MTLESLCHQKPSPTLSIWLFLESYRDFIEKDGVVRNVPLCGYKKSLGLGRWLSGSSACQANRRI